MRTLHHCDRSDRGQILIEAAITFPLVLLSLVGMFELGRMFQTTQVLTNAAREGARIAIVPNMDASASESTARAYMQQNGLSASATATVNINRNITLNANGTPESASEVRIDYPFQFFMLQPVIRLVVPASTTGSPITLRASAVMRNEMP